MSGTSARITKADIRWHVSVVMGPWMSIRGLFDGVWVEVIARDVKVGIITVIDIFNGDIR